VTANVSISPVGDLTRRRIFIENIFPSVEGGRFAVKRIAGEPVQVWADILRHGHAVLGVALLWRPEAAQQWTRVPMRLHENDRWMASFTPLSPGRYDYAVEAWTDPFATWRRDFLAKRKAGLDVELEIREGRELLARLNPPNLAPIYGGRQGRRASDVIEAVDFLLSDEVAAATAKGGERADLSRSAIYPLVVDRSRARAGAWYEMVPRSQGRIAGRHGTFDDCISRLPDVAALGFDVLYLTPIHPIGRTNRKGRNNALRAEKGDPGSFYAIGSSAGGHDAVHPELGTLPIFAD